MQVNGRKRRLAIVTTLAVCGAIGASGCGDNGPGLAGLPASQTDTDGGVASAGKGGPQSPVGGTAPTASTRPSCTGCGPLGEDQLRLLSQALDREYFAWSLYRRLEQDLGDGTQPFHNVSGSEQRHCQTLGALYARRNVPIPPNPYTPEDIEVPDVGGRGEACQLALRHERQLIALYDALLTPAAPRDVENVVLSLRTASREHHASVFLNCAGT